MEPLTLPEKVWQNHVIKDDLIYIDLHLLHEVTSPQAFEGLRLAGRKIRRPDLTVATADHNVPTKGLEIVDETSRIQLKTLAQNAEEFGVRLFEMGDPNQGIVHVVGPQLGLTRPGMTIVCGDSHTSTHGAFGALAFGIGTSQVEHVMATQTIHFAKPTPMAITVNGQLNEGVSAKDVILAIIAKIGTGGGQGHVLEYRGDVITNLSMEGRMTVCNMSIEAGARAGMIAPDETTWNYIGEKVGEDLITDEGAHFDKEVILDGEEITPFVTWGTNPGQGVPLAGRIPDDAPEEVLNYMGLKAGTQMRDIAIDTVFVGSCTNGRIEDLRAAAKVLDGKKVSTRTLVVPGSYGVRQQAEKEGLDKIFLEAGAEWRLPGCSMCLAMNGDQLAPGERAASTSNRNFEGRQGPGGRTHLVSPAVAAATAVAGHLAAPADL